MKIIVAACAALLSILIMITVLAGCGGGNSRTSVAPSQTISLQATSGAGLLNADWVAFQDGNGPWQPVVPTSTGVYTCQVTDPAGRYAYAVVHAASSGVDARIYCATVNELPHLHITTGGGSTGSDTVSGTFSGAVADETNATVSIGSSGYLYSGLTGPGDARAFSFSLAPGQYDAGAITYQGGVLPSRIYLERNLAVTGNLTHDISLANSANVFALPDQYLVGYTGFDASGAAVNQGASVSFRTRNGTAFSLGAGANPGPAGSFSYAALPAARVVAGDAYEINLLASRQDNAASRSTQLFFGSAGHKTLTLQPWLTGANVTIPSGGAYQRPAAVWNPYPAAIFYSLAYNAPAPGGAPIAWNILLTRDWLAGATAFSLPDFSALAGWNAGWGIPNTAVISNATITATACNRPLLEYLSLFNIDLSQLADTQVAYASSYFPNLTRRATRSPLPVPRPRDPLFPLR